MPTLGVEQYQYGDAGLLLNGDSDSLPFVDVTSIEGVDSAPVRTQTHDREGVHGGYVDAEFEQIRTVTLEGTIYTDPYNSEGYLDQLKANFAPSKFAQPFYVQTDGGQRVVWGKSLGLKYRKDVLRRIGLYEFQVQLECEDPRWYDPVPIVGSTPLVTVVTSGRSYPKTYPVLYGAAAGTSSFSIVLGGNRDTPAKIRINGPVINPYFIYDNTGTVMAFTYTVDEEDYIEINLSTRSVLLNGVTPVRRFMAVQGNWFLLEPGNNDFRYFGIQTESSTQSTLSVTAYSAWR